MSVATDLRAAADYLRTYGWVREYHHHRGVPNCIIGAIEQIQGHEISSGDAAYLAVQEVIGYPGIGGFNDLHCETADDAIAVLEIAADLATPSPEAANDHH